MGTDHLVVLIDGPCSTSCSAATSAASLATSRAERRSRRARRGIVSFQMLLGEKKRDGTCSTGRDASRIRWACPRIPAVSSSRSAPAQPAAMTQLPESARPKPSRRSHWSSGRLRVMHLNIERDLRMITSSNGSNAPTLTQPRSAGRHPAAVETGPRPGGVRSRKWLARRRRSRASPRVTRSAGAHPRRLRRHALDDTLLAVVARSGRGIRTAMLAVQIRCVPPRGGQIPSPVIPPRLNHVRAAQAVQKRRDEQPAYEGDPGEQVTPSESPRLLEQAIEPLESDPPHPHGRTRYITGDEAQADADSNERDTRQLVAQAKYQQVLLRKA